jgi:hypothetical protein
MEAVRSKIHAGAMFLMVWFLSSVSTKGQELTEVRVLADESPVALQTFTVSNVNELDDSFPIDVSALTGGLHTLHVQVRDANGWSHYASQNVQIQGGAGMDQLYAAEYFFDQDPGPGNGIQIPLSGETASISPEIDLSGLSRGMHFLSVRVRNESGQWSHAHSQLVQVTGGEGQSELHLAEYFFDTDPGFGNGSPLSYPPSPALDETFGIQIPEGLSEGTHMLYIRVRDGAGQWSHYAGHEIQACAIELPEITVTGTACTGNEIQLSVSGPYASYAWNTGSSDPSVVITESGNYSVTVADEDCSALASESIEFAEPVQPVISAEGNILTVSPAGFSYQWYLNDEAIQNATGHVHEATEAGYYSVEMDDGTCTGLSGSIYVAPDGITETSQGNILIYPNPATSLVLVEADTQPPHRWKIRDLAGRVIRAGEATNRSVALDVHDLAAGSYFLQIGNSLHRINVIH